MEKANIKFGNLIRLMLMVSVMTGCASVSPKPKVDTVEIKDMKFTPSDVSVNKGDTVIWINHDMMAHDVTEEKNTWTSSVIPAGASWKMAITNDVSYYCSIHLVMKGKVSIK